MDKKDLRNKSLIKNLSITNSTVFETIKIVISILIALAITFVILLFVSDNPVNAFRTILTGALTKKRYLGIVFEQMITYTFAGLACGLLFKAGFFNLGAEGIYVLTGVVCSAVACNALTTNAILHPALAIVASALVGGVLMLIPAILKAKFEANELVISLMLNSIYSALSVHIVRNYLLSTTTSTIGTPSFLSSASLLNKYLIKDYHIGPMFILMIIVVILMQIMLKKTKLGYQIRVAGTNPSFADYSGINAFKLALITNFIAGALAGMGSAVHVLTQMSFYQPSVSVVGIGFTGCLLAMLGRNNPIGIMVATFFIRYLEEGASVLYFNDNSVPSEIIAIVEGIVVLLVSSQYFLRRYREKKLLKEGLEKND